MPEEKSRRLVRYLSSHSKWDKYDHDEEVFIQELPKVELHVHLDGSFDPHYLWKYMKEHPESLYCLPVQADLPWDDSQTLLVRQKVQDCQSPEDFHKLCTCRGYRSLKAMLNCFEFFLPLVRRNVDLLEQLAFDFVQRQWEQNIVYTEVRYSPCLLAEEYQKSDEDSPFSPEDIFLAITQGLRRGTEQFGITVNQILSAITWQPDWAATTLDLAHKYRESYPCAVVGVDVAAGEEHFDSVNFPQLYQPHYDMIQKAKELEIPITIHAGEVPTKDALSNAHRAVQEYGARRIGHGYRVASSAEIMAEFKEKGIHIEVCPTSSVETGGWMYEEGQKDWREHPVIPMIEHGLSVSFNSDDPSVFHTSLAWQYRVALAKMELTRDHLVRSNLHAIDAAFCSDDEKLRLRELVECFGSSKTSDKECQTKAYSREASADSFADRVYVAKGRDADGHEYF